MQNGFLPDVRPFFTEKAYFAFCQSGNLLSKIHAITLSYVRRVILLLQSSSYDLIFIHREATPLGPPILEYVFAKILKKKIIYDFDDAIWLTDKTGESTFIRIIRWRSKVGAICKWSHQISCGNAYLGEYARKFNSNVSIIPTTIDTLLVHLPPKRKSITGKITIGWTGSHSTLKYLQNILPALQSIEKKYPEIDFLIIADEDPKLPLRNQLFLPWRKETEISDLGTMDVGIMPLPDDPWTRGKCGFKALQYMAMAIPAVVSPVGVNRKIIRHGREGYWCETENDWLVYLEDLILHAEKRSEMGKRGRQKVVDHYSVASNADNFLSLFQ